MGKTTKENYTENRMTALLREKYVAPEWIFIPQVRNAAGFNATRTADGIAISSYQASGYEVHGFEVKVNRSDWLSAIRKR